MFEDLDQLARGLAENDISRRQAIRWAGYSVLGATLSSMGFAETAEALTRRQRRRCRRKGGTPVAKGECQCASTCSGGPIFCNSSQSCACFKTTEGKGFCSSGFTGPNLCTSSADCAAVSAGAKCISSLDPCVPSVCAAPCRTP